MLDIIFILDESFSMRKYINSYIQGINEFINTQKQINPDTNFTLIKFNSTINVLCVNSKIHTLPVFTHEHYNPMGSTALYDAIGYGINLKYSNHVQNVMMIIITDGNDNSSSKFTINNIADNIKYLKQQGWEFLYVAANQNAQNAGNKLGIETCLSYNETSNSISQISKVCNIAVGHALKKWTGKSNQYTNQEIPTDVKDLMDGFNDIKI